MQFDFAALAIFVPFWLILAIIFRNFRKYRLLIVYVAVAPALWYVFRGSPFVRVGLHFVFGAIVLNYLLQRRGFKRWWAIVLIAFAFYTYSDIYDILPH